MDLFNQAIHYLLPRQSMPLKFSPPARNHIDVDQSLLQYHKSGLGPKPAPQPTSFLPLRTRLAAGLLSGIRRAQTEAYYEEFDNIPAASLELQSEFKAGHWYAVHPITYFQVREMNVKVLQDLLEWIEKIYPNEFFVDNKLARREKRGEIGDEEGYTGSWEVLDDDKKGKAKEESAAKGEERKERMDPAALEAAREVGRKAAEDAKDMDEYKLLH
ncbi:hypothetical protein EK21DRAFT_104832 [Setomelanomma holmii]|uniref:Uncharacterized protein n=1 Tax=Setomelanomma holmii TaxID=210430 RepID=A0A9P4LHJ6_9PLEO|nr:hypothetical protein EK21DRAFT_104832 [Setomelanomma holmii]